MNNPHDWNEARLAAGVDGNSDLNRGWKRLQTNRGTPHVELKQTLRVLLCFVILFAIVAAVSLSVAAARGMWPFS